MKTFSLLVLVVISFVSLAQGAEPIAKQYMRHLCGDDGVDIAKICYPAPDLWMLDTSRNDEALSELQKLIVPSKQTGTVSTRAGHILLWVETRDGKIDPAINLESQYQLQRTSVRWLIYLVLRRDEERLKELVTDRSKLEITGPTAASGDMDVYAMVIEGTPVIRTSKPVDDAKTKSVSYRLPVGDESLNVTLVNDKGQWKVDTSKRLRVPLEGYFASNKYSDKVFDKFTGDIEFANMGTERLWVDVAGFDNNPGCGYLVKGGDKSSNMGPQTIPEKVLLTWNKDGQPKQHTEVAIPEDVRKATRGTLRFEFSGDGKWSVSLEAK